MTRASAATWVVCARLGVLRQTLHLTHNHRGCQRSQGLESQPGDGTPNIACGTTRRVVRDRIGYPDNPGAQERIRSNHFAQLVNRRIRIIKNTLNAHCRLSGGRENQVAICSLIRYGIQCSLNVHPTSRYVCNQPITSSAPLKMNSWVYARASSGIVSPLASTQHLSTRAIARDLRSAAWLVVGSGFAREPPIEPRSSS